MPKKKQISSDEESSDSSDVSSSSEESSDASSSSDDSSSEESSSVSSSSEEEPVKRKVAVKRKRKAGAKKKDPLRPKKARTAYTYFVAENRASIKEKNPDLSFGELSREVAAQWKAMGEKEKKVFTDKSAKDKVRYSKEMENYVEPSASEESSDEDVPQKGGKKKAPPKKKAKKDPNMPKRGMNGFMFYVQDNRLRVKENNPDFKAVDITKKLGEEWRGLNEKQKAPYQKKSEDDKARYLRQMEVYNAKKN